MRRSERFIKSYTFAERHLPPRSFGPTREQILSLHKQLPLALTLHEQTALERQIEATDRQIDAHVNELYALTEVEIWIMEERLWPARI